MIAIGNGGWVRVDLVDLPGPLYVRFAQDGGRWVVADFYLDGRGERITGAMLRTLPLADIEEVCNSAGFGAHIASRAAVASVPLSTVASFFATTVGPRNRTWVGGMLRGEAVTTRPHRGDAVHLDVPPLRAPDRGLDRAFLAEVGRAYAAAVQRGEHPAKALAAQAGVPVRSVHRWLYLARKAGTVPPSGRPPRTTKTEG